jgi:hypothetical protein
VRFGGLATAGPKQSIVARSRTEIKIRTIELPVRDGLDFYFNTWTQGIDLLRQMEVDYRPIVKPQSSAKGIECDLQSTVEIPPVRRFEVVNEVDAER